MANILEEISNQILILQLTQIMLLNLQRSILLNIYLHTNYKL